MLGVPIKAAGLAQFVSMAGIMALFILLAIILIGMILKSGYFF
jgi:hypothetical protein